MPRRAPLLTKIAGFAAICLSVSSPASAGVTLGSPLSGERGSSSGLCEPPCVLMQSELPGRTLAAPYRGLIARWGVVYACDPIRLRVLRPEGDGFRFVASSEWKTSCTPKQWEVSIPVEPGDRIALETAAEYFPATSRSGAAYQRFAGAPADGSTSTPEAGPYAAELLFNATVEPDADEDGHGDDSVDRCVGSPDQSDTDDDKSGDACDADDDNDGLGDVDEASRGTDPTKPDTDGDYINDRVDNCPTTSSSSQADLDSDGAGDPCDADDDADGLSDETEGHHYSRDPDTDGDRRLDGADNCPRKPNPAQEDADRDGPGDACDDDDDSDGVDDETDNCPLVVNPDQRESPVRDDPGDACDGDLDNDRLSDVREAQRGSSSADLDSDDDGLSDGREVHDSRTDPTRRDTDRDRLPDGLELGATKPVADPPGAVTATDRRRFRRDRDARSKTNPRRADSDRDRLTDGREDRDRDGLWDRRETDPSTRDSDYDGAVDGRDRRPLRPSARSEGTSKIRCTLTSDLEYQCRLRVIPSIEVQAPSLSCTCTPYGIVAYAAVDGSSQLKRRRSGGRVVFTGRERRVSVNVGFRTVTAINTGRRPVDVYFSMPLEF